MGLAQAHSNYLMYTTLGFRHNHTTTAVTNPGLGEDPAYMGDCYTPAAYSFRNHVESNAKSVQFTDYLEWLDLIDYKML